MQACTLALMQLHGIGSCQVEFARGRSLGRNREMTVVPEPVSKKGINWG